MAPPAPINRKYLCAAPRPESWNAYAANTLRSIGVNNDEREACLRTTIDAARAMHADSIKVHIGPGRKSNAEHAIAFYEYLLGLVMQGWGDDKVEETPVAGVKTAKKTKEYLAEPAAVPEEATVSPPHPLVHNDKCEVCEDTSNDGTEFIKCSTCPRVFHPTCHRPLAERVPVDESWRCSYCVLASEPRATKPRRVSAAGVRLMGRVRNQLLRRRNKRLPGEAATTLPGQEAAEASEDDQEHTETEDGTEDEEPEPESAEAKVDFEGATLATTDDQPEDVGALSDTEEAGLKVDRNIETAENEAAVYIEQQSTSEGSQAALGDDNLAVDEGPASGETEDSTLEAPVTPNVKKVKAVLQQLGSLSLPIESDSAGRSKRNRKQPTLYDPQTVPARSWVSDEVQYLSTKETSQSNQTAGSELAMNTEEKQDDEMADLDKESSIALQRKRRAKARKDGSVDGAWCNFCGDNPDIPLCCFCACKCCFSKHDQAHVLLCDTCHDEYHTFCLDPPMTSSPLPPSWHCPQCSASRDKRVSRTSAKRRTAMQKNIVDNAESHRRSVSPRRSAAASSTVVAKEKRGPGRPRKNAAAPTVALAHAGKKRGRPSKVNSEPPRKRGRPFKGTSVSSEDGMVSSKILARLTDPRPGSALDEMAFEAPDGPITISRSGRTVKRSTFHDEIGHGEQHLRAYRDQQRRLDGGSMCSVATSNGSTTPPRFGVDDDAFDINRPIESVASQSINASAATAPTPANTPMQLIHEVQPATVHDPSVASTLSAAAQSLYASFDGNHMAVGPPFATTRHEKDRGPRRKPGARECMQMSRRFGAQVISENHMEILSDYCQRGKVEHLIRMRERLDDHARYLESQLAGLESAVKENGESDVVVPAAAVADDIGNLL